MASDRRFDEDDATFGRGPWAASPPPAPSEPESRAPEARAPEARAPEAREPEPRPEPRAAQPPTPPEPVAPVGPSPERAAAPQPAQQPRRRGLLGRLLAGVVLLGAGGALALYLAPQIAPSLPEPYAAFLAPGAAAANDALAREAEARAALEARVDALAARLDDRVAETADAAAAAQSAADAAATRAAALEESVAALDGRLTGIEALSDELARVEARLAEKEAALTALTEGADAVSLSALIERIEGLGLEVAAVSTGGAAPTEVASRLEALEVSQDEESALLAEAIDARRDAQLATALADLERAAARSGAFRDVLDDAAALAAEPPPAALVAAAEGGAPTLETLRADFTPAAHEAIEAALTAGDEGARGPVGGFLARMRARVTGLPAEPIEGADAQAVLSRARHAVEKGDLEGALVELEALPAAARPAMEAWTAAATRRRDADAALADWRRALRAEP